MVQQRHEVAVPPAPRSLLDFIAITTRARQLRTASGQARGAISSRLLLETCFPRVRVTGERLPRPVRETVTARPDGSATIVYNRKLDTPTQRVAVVHGLGHLVFDLDEGGELRCDEGAELVASERRCDLFAAEVLAPLDEIDALFPGSLRPRSAAGKSALADDVDYVASRLRVPAKLVRERLRDLVWIRKTSWSAG